MRNALLILVAGALLAACGQRGPLYLPDEERIEVGPVAVPLSSPLPRTTPVPAPAAGPAGAVDEDENAAPRPNRN
jgi:hypothetical protein